MPFPCKIFKPNGRKKLILEDVITPIFGKEGTITKWHSQKLGKEIYLDNFECPHCKRESIRTSKRQKFCRDCAAARMRSSIKKAQKKYVKKQKGH